MSKAPKAPAAVLPFRAPERPCRGDRARHVDDDEQRVGIVTGMTPHEVFVTYDEGDSVETVAWPARGIRVVARATYSEVPSCT